MAFLLQRTMPDSQPHNSEPATNMSALQSLFNERSRKQLSLFAAGAGFFAISALITRRSLVRRYKLTQPGYFHPSSHAPEVNGAMEAFEALNVATVNVLSVSMMATGGALWAFDISSIDDLRYKMRKQFGIDPDRSEKDVEEEIEEWFATVLERKDKKGKKGVESVTTILEKIAEKENGKSPFEKGKDEQDK
ncbi:hypothetical protein B0O99DRAFT_196785 [Bisporella sp. PMI_857]|nr:hypothetical protein B0O99DRAFT_196785 [Bisporella sp. PMI_857]